MKKMLIGLLLVASVGTVVGCTDTKVVSKKGTEIVEARINGSINYKDEKFNANITLGKIAGVEIWLDVNELRKAFGK